MDLASYPSLGIYYNRTNYPEAEEIQVLGFMLLKELTILNMYLITGVPVCGFGFICTLKQRKYQASCHMYIMYSIMIQLHIQCVFYMYLYHGEWVYQKH